MAKGGREVKEQAKVQTRKRKRKILRNQKCTRPIIPNALNV